ncbi:ABC transporter permease [Phytoactinopolyspora halophila]|nr:ABC transporter permease [Phytoactinopolyspora halophila]
MALQASQPTERQEVPEEGASSPPRWRVQVDRHRAFLSSLVFFVVMLLAFMITSPAVFLSTGIYLSVFASSLPLVLIVAVPLVFVFVSGEIDVSFPSVVGIAAYAFAASYAQGLDPFAATLFAIVVGAFVGFINGCIVTYVGLPSLVVTLGMLFLLRGLVQVLSDGEATSLIGLHDTLFEQIFMAKWAWLPAPMAWATLLAVLGLALFSAHKFGAHVRAIGDNSAAANQMGIKVRRTRVLAFVYVGAAGGVAGVLAVTINSTFYPTTGDGLLLLVLAAVFVGGTPVWGGTGTVAGAIVGAATVGFIETGIISAGLTGNYTQLFYGLVILLSLVGHRISNKSALTR